MRGDANAPYSIDDARRVTGIGTTPSDVPIRAHQDQRLLIKLRDIGLIDRHHRKRQFLRACGAG
jgi:hypothetical protein